MIDRLERMNYFSFSVQSRRQETKILRLYARRVSTFVLLEILLYYPGNLYRKEAVY